MINPFFLIFNRRYVFGVGNSRSTNTPSPTRLSNSMQQRNLRRSNYLPVDQEGTPTDRRVLREEKNGIE